MLRTTNAHMYHTASDKLSDYAYRPLASLDFYEMLLQFDAGPVDPDVLNAEAVLAYEEYGNYR